MTEPSSITQPFDSVVRRYPAREGELHSVAMNTAIVPFRIDIADDVLEDLRDRLARTRFPDEVNDDDWSYGTQLDYLKELCAYWCDEFDWRAREAELNRFEQFKTTIGGLGLHFICARSEEPNALPLLITHGWPGSVTEFSKIIEPLRNPRAYGGSASDAFHVVCPSIPGYGFSEAAKEPGMDAKRVARHFAELMARLGFDRYGAQGGDWGSAISTLLGVVDPDHCIGIHLNMLTVRPPKDSKDPLEGLSEAELTRFADRKRFTAEQMGYFRIQASKPQSLGYGLNDSPSGLAAWIVEKFRAWSDCDGDIERRFSKDDLLTNITLYWVTQTITSSTRLYRENTHSRRGMAEVSRVPTGAAIFPGELALMPRAWAEHTYNLIHWTEMPSGGHFAAMEEPELLIEDIRAFFRKVR